MASQVSATPQSSLAHELPSMLATLYSYESRFGPYHPQTLGLMTAVAKVKAEQGEIAHACALLERVLRDQQKMARRDCALRLHAIIALRDIWVQQRDQNKAAAAQREVLECQTEIWGAEHPETLAARHELATLLLRAA